jgi:hypothetical protein
MERHTPRRVAGNQCTDPHHVCHEIAQEVRDMAVALYTGRLSATLFEKSLIALEAAKVKRFGLHLTAHRLPDGSSRFRLENVANGKTCATLDFNPLAEELEIHDALG